MVFRIRLLKDALSLTQHKQKGTIFYRDGEETVSADAMSIVKDEIFFHRKGEDDRIPLHRISRVEIDGQVIWRKGIGIKNLREQDDVDSEDGII